MVGQEPVLYATTIQNNISYGLDECDQEMIEDSAKKANAHPFIIQQPKGYETETGEKGVQLSGITRGQLLLISRQMCLADFGGYRPNFPTKRMHFGW